MPGYGPDFNVTTGSVVKVLAVVGGFFMSVDAAVALLVRWLFF